MKREGNRSALQPPGGGKQQKLTVSRQLIESPWMETPIFGHLRTKNLLKTAHILVYAALFK
jgi:hypothetical protein